MFLRLIVIAAFLICSTPLKAEPLEGDYLYKVTTVRAATGKLEDLLNWVAEMKASDYFDEIGAPAPFVMRHSQGDQWDLLKIEPMGSWRAYHSKSNEKRRAKAAATYGENLAAGSAFVAFAEDHFAYGPPIEEIETAFDKNSFFHIEMFKAAPGKMDELTK